MTIPQPLFGTFVENGLPEVKRFCQVTDEQVIEKFVTLPFAKDLKAVCDIHYLDGELEASLHFAYDQIQVPYAPALLMIDHLLAFVTSKGILARNLTEEQKIVDELFQDFSYNPTQGVFVTKSDKKIVEFMTEVVPQNQNKVIFNCPQNLKEQFLYDSSTFSLNLRETDRIDAYLVELKVDGYLNGVLVDQLWECLATKKSYIELKKTHEGAKKKGVNKILVLDLEKIAPIVQIFDELGIQTLSDHVEERPLWSLASVDEKDFENLPIQFSMSQKLKKIQEQMRGAKAVETKEIPSQMKAEFRPYQKEGVQWMDRLRQMHLNGVLADDMGLGKTLQAIAALTQFQTDEPKAVSLVVCPTSLVYNWDEEIHKFNPKMKVLTVDGTPGQRKKLIEDLKQYDVLITSYSLLQKDIDLYKETVFGYCVLDEAQHIKNRSTRNAKSVKMIKSLHRLILTGTPIENSLDELWSLFDFLMPGLLSSYERFMEKYIRSPVKENSKNLDLLKRKLSPFILRRMKKDVLSELPPVSEIVYHCHLTDTQENLYKSYAASAREELSQLVKKEGFEKVQIHVLATLTRLKQICCHPAIFAKEDPESGDSAKYEMLMELLQNLIDGNHKTVIFSQYTRMLNIIRNELKQRGILFEYLDGASKNRMGIVKRFNEDTDISVFLVSLKAGGSGLNLTGADTVIHYDMWWNPAVESQATDRVHRIGQQNSVSSYKLVTLGTIEEKIVELQNRKKGLVKKVISSDEEVMSKLTWEEVLELLQT
jgi:SNF2 family DNA or RNA helicase